MIGKTTHYWTIRTGEQAKENLASSGHLEEEVVPSCLQSLSSGMMTPVVLPSDLFANVLYVSLEKAVLRLHLCIYCTREYSTMHCLMVYLFHHTRVITGGQFSEWEQRIKVSIFTCANQFGLVKILCSVCSQVISKDVFFPIFASLPFSLISFHSLFPVPSFCASIFPFLFFYLSHSFFQFTSFHFLRSFLPISFLRSYCLSSAFSSPSLPSYPSFVAHFPSPSLFLQSPFPSIHFPSFLLSLPLFSLLFYPPALPFLPSFFFFQIYFSSSKWFKGCSWINWCHFSKKCTNLAFFFTHPALYDHVWHM